MTKLAQEIVKIANGTLKYPPVAARVKTPDGKTMDLISDEDWAGSTENVRKLQNPSEAMSLKPVIGFGAGGALVGALTGYLLGKKIPSLMPLGAFASITGSMLGSGVGGIAGGLVERYKYNKFLNEMEKKYPWTSKEVARARDKLELKIAPAVGVGMAPVAAFSII